MRENYSVLIRKKLHFILVYVTFKSSNLQKLYLSFCVVCIPRMAAKILKTRLLAIEKLSAAILFFLLVASQSDYRILNI